MEITRCSRSTNNVEMRLREAPKCTSQAKKHREQLSNWDRIARLQQQG
jgi:hypothetical protein